MIEACKNVCLNEECKKDTYVELELDDSVKEEELNADEILKILKEEIGLDTSGILIGWVIDESGKIIRVMIYVDDEATANTIRSQITDVWLEAKGARIFVNGDYLSCEPMNFVGELSHIVLFFFVVVLYDAVVVP